MPPLKNKCKTIFYVASLLLCSCGSSNNFIDDTTVGYLPQGEYYMEISDIASNISNQYPLCVKLFSYPSIVSVNNNGQICTNNSCGVTIKLTEYDYDQCAEESSQTDMGEMMETIDFCEYADTVFSGVIQKEYPSKKLVCSAILIMYPVN